MLLSALAALAIGAPQARAVVRVDPVKAKPAAVEMAVTRTAQYDGPYKRRFRPRRWRGQRGGFRRPFVGRRQLMSMQQAVMLVRSQVPGRIANASLRGRFAWFRVISRGRVLTVVVNRVTRRLRVRPSF